MPLLSETYHSLFARAISEELGIYVNVTNAPQFQHNLDVWRKSCGVQEFSEIMVCVPSVPDKVFLVKKSVELE